MGESRRLSKPVRPEDPSLEQQVFALCTEPAEQAGGYLVPHMDEHTINIVFAGHQVTVKVEARDKPH